MKRDLKSFYQVQNDLVVSLVSLQRLGIGSSESEKLVTQESATNDARRAKIAIYLSFIVNVILFIIKIYAAATSVSITVIASALDSFLDLMSGSIMFLTNWVINSKNNPYKFPVGKARLEPIGIIVFAACMFTATMQVVIEAIQVLASGNNDKFEMEYSTIGIICFVVVSKFSLYIFCRTIKGSASVEALAADHRNDVLTNTFGTVLAIAAKYWLWWLDPVGGILLSAYIMLNWFRQGMLHVVLLTGKSASPRVLQQLTFVAVNHDPRILKVDTVRAYHLGIGLIVEVDIVLPEKMSLKDTHDIGESLQIKYEQLAQVERAVVHIDYEWAHEPEHAKDGEGAFSLVDVED